MRKIKLPDGKQYTFAPLGFTENAVQLVELQERMDAEDFHISAFLRCMRANAQDSLKAGGHSSAEIESALSSIPIALKSQAILKSITAAMLDQDE